MMASGGAKVWFTAQELADLGLPGLSKAKRKINETAAAARWALKVDGEGMPLARPRAGRGGGVEYHLSVLPAAAQLELVKRGIAGPGPSEPTAPPASVAGQLWSWFDNQPQKTKDEAAFRLKVLGEVEALTATGLTATAAIAVVAAKNDCASSSIWGWTKLIKGVAPADRLPHLAPRRVGGGAEAVIDEGAWQFLISDYLRPSAPTFASCYARLLEDYAKPRGLSVPSSKTLQRKLEREVDGRLVIAKRSGQDALRATVPYQQRTVADLSALELVNIDGHRWDVFVQGENGAKPYRPTMVAIQDVYSRKILAWRVGETESAVLTRLAFADLFRKWGIPAGCLMDNGRAFASKWITGGATSRFRFKIRPEEPTGLLTSLGIKIHWALPFRGSSKPIERAFRDLCDSVAKHPAFEGAYTGNRPDAKPENYGSKAVPLDVFLAVAAKGIEAHNAKVGRRTEMARNGESFDQVFEASYTRSPVRKATPEQLRLALLTADTVTTNRKSGEISLYGNRYWCDALYETAGERVIVRFDPDALQSEVHVYRASGEFLATAPVIAAVGFMDAGAAKARARQEAEVKKRAKALEDAQNLLSAQQLADLIPNTIDEDEPTPPSVIRPVKARGVAVAQATAAKPQRAPVVDRLIDFSAPEPVARPSLTVLDGGVK
jgi:hypothetical protein